MANRSLEEEIEIVKGILLEFNDDRETKDIFRKAVKYWRKAVKEHPDSNGTDGFVLDSAYGGISCRNLRIRIPKYDK
ncbi:MAG: hypothetical protein V1734_00035 [Nanoarchaeota archaeon]